MAQITTTTASDPLGVPANTRVDRDPATGYLYALVRSTTANTWDLYRSTNGGGAWSLHLSLLRSGIQEMGSTFIANDGHLYVSYRTNEGGQDRIYFRRCRLNNPVWGPETLTGNPAHGGTAGAIHQGMDIQLVGGTAGRYMRIVIAVGTTFGGTSGITLYGVLLDQPAGTHRYDNTFLRGKRQWMDITGTHRIVPSVDIEHTGDGKSADVPHLWVTYGRDVLRMVKLGWTGAGWSGPATTQLLQTGLPAQDGITGRWDGARWLMVVPHPTATDAVLLVERNRGNTTTVLRQTPAHPAGVVRTVGLSYSRVVGRTTTDATRVYAVGTSNADLYFVDFNRAAGTWTSWTTVSTTDVIGSPPSQFSLRRGAATTPVGSGSAVVADARHTVAIAHPGTPNTVVSYHQTVTYSPNTPTWDVPAIGVTNGAAAEVTSPLNLDWVFSDPDPNDVQSAWSLSRQIGNGPLMYLRTSDSTWQATEQKNAGATTNRTLPAMIFGDSFNDRTVTGGLGGGWSVSGGGGAGDFAVNAGTAQVTHNTVGALRHGLVDTGSTDHAVVFDATIPVMPAGNALSVWALARVTDTSTYYEATLSIGTSGAAFLNLGKRVAGTLTGIGGGTAVGTHTAGATWRIVLEVTGSTLRAKAWMPASQAEPGWQTTQTDTALTTGTLAGFAGRLEAGNTNGTVVFGHDDFVVAVGGAGAPPWGLTSDAAHSYKVKVWDSSDTASLYSDAFVVLPSGKVNPLITSPTEGQTITTDQVTVTWTAAEQTQYRVRLLIFGADLHDSGWRSGGDTSYQVPTVLTNTFSYSLLVQTRNLKGLASDAVQRNFSVAFVEPPRPSLVAAPQPANGVIRVTVANPAAAGTEPAFVSQELWRRPVTTPILNANPGFEGGSTAGWGPAVGGTGAPSTEQAQSGGWSYKVIPDGVSALAYAESIKLPCTEGLTYDAYGWIRAVTANKPTAVFFRWYNAGGPLSNTITTMLPPAAGLWRARSQLAVAPAGATQMTLCAGGGSTPAAGDIVYVDELRIRVADPSNGIRVAAGLPSGAVVDDWRAVSGVDYEYRAVVRAANGASAFGPWTP